jgi:hypothetical protein
MAVAGFDAPPSRVDPNPWTLNHKKVQPLWRQEGLRVPQPRRRERVGSSTAPDTQPLTRRTGYGRWTSSRGGTATSSNGLLRDECLNIELL